VELPHGVGCLEEVLAEQVEAISKLRFRGSHEMEERLAAPLPPDLAEWLHITTSGDWFCEVMAAAATKAAAVEWTASCLGLDPGGILAIGDSPNDSAMP
jgi:hydroxymethylpyrimidine pyrophosphatase-like HAD family hydrolase